MDDARKFKRLVRNMRRASNVSGRLIGCEVVHRGGHVYRLVPGRAFDEALALLTTMSGAARQISSPTGEPK